jgi:hypothetical protein
MPGASFALSGVSGNLLFATSATDPLTFGLIGISLAVDVLLADTCRLTARHASVRCGLRARSRKGLAQAPPPGDIIDG